MTRVLVAYASKHGATAEIAQAIARELTRHGLAADCVDVAHATLDGADALVLGSAVYLNRWRPEAVAFVKRHRDALGALPFWVFSSGPVGTDTAEDPDDPARAQPRKAIELVEAAGAREHVVFGGRMPRDPDGLMERMMVRGTPEQLSDARDWDAIRRWAARIAQALEAAPA